MRTEPLTAEELFQAISRADREKHEFFQGWLDAARGLDDVTLDGHFNLERIAEILNED